MSKYGVFLVHIFPHSDRIRRDTEYLSKVDDGFLVGIFLYDGFSNPYRSDSNFEGGGGIALFVSEDIPSILLGIENKPIEASLFRIKFAK